MFQATTAVYNALKREQGLKVFTEERSDSSEAWLSFGIDNGPSYRIRFISKDNDNDVAVRVFSLVKVDEVKKEKILPVLNSINAKYRFLKFVCDSDGDVNVEYDFLVSGSDPGASAGEIVARIVKIIDEVYPDLMRAMWS